MLNFSSLQLCTVYNSATITLCAHDGAMLKRYFCNEMLLVVTKSIPLSIKALLNNLGNRMMVTGAVITVLAAISVGNSCNFNKSVASMLDKRVLDISMAKDYILEMTLRVKNLNVCIKPDWTKKAVSQWHGILLNDGNDKYLLCGDICRWKMDAKIGPSRTYQLD